MTVLADDVSSVLLLTGSKMAEDKIRTDNVRFDGSLSTRGMAQCHPKAEHILSLLGTHSCRETKELAEALIRHNFGTPKEVAAYLGVKRQAGGQTNPNVSA